MSELDPSDIFRQEAAELMEQLELSLLDLERTPDAHDLIDRAFRALHTLKGSGAMFGFDQVAAFIHDFETAFDHIRKGRAAPNAELIKIALEAKDHIRQLIEDPRQADGAHGAAILATLAAVTKQSASSDAARPPVESRAPEAASGKPKRWHLNIAFDNAILSNGNNPLLMFDELQGLGPCRIVAEWQNVPPLCELHPQLLYLSWDIRLETDRPLSILDEVFIFVRDEMRLDVEEEPAEEKGPIAAPAAGPPKRAAPVKEDTPASPAAREAATIRVPAERLDAMMDRVGELVIAQARLSQLAAANDEAMKSVAEDIARLTSALREAMMNIRMVPVGSLFVRFRRLLHDLSRDLGKEIELKTVGDDTEMDKTMIERLADPLVHVIRNAADHGLEDPEIRMAGGKPRVGRIELVARHAGAEVLLSVRDDGRGLDAGRIRQKAEEQGLIAPGASMTDAQLYPLIFAPGFSTAGTVSALSGRGVGMDVVKKTIEAMRGSVDITTAHNEGTTIAFRLPLTLAIIEGLLVRLGAGRYVIPLTAVEECVELSQIDDTRSQGRSFLNIRGDLVPFMRLRQLFEEHGEPDRYQKVVIVSTGDNRIGLVVDQIIGNHQTVIKSLSKLHVDQKTFSGATILGDGTVALILDIPHLVSLGQDVETRLKADSLELVAC